MQSSSATAGAFRKLHMTNSADPVNADIKIKFDRTPTAPVEKDLRDELKNHSFKWTGFGDDAKWVASKEAIDMFESRDFLARAKLAVGAVSYYAPDGTNVDRTSFIEAVRMFDPDAVDTDLDSLPKSSVPVMSPAKAPTPAAERKRPRS